MTRTAPTHPASTSASTRPSARARPSARRVVRACATAASKVVVVGAGWGGLGAAKTLCEAGCQVTLVDAQDDPTGATPTVTASGKPFEPGTRGFWKDYPNITSLVRELGERGERRVHRVHARRLFGLPMDWRATAPVFGDSVALPSPLGQIFATFDNFKRLPLTDRASMVGLLYAAIST